MEDEVSLSDTLLVPLEDTGDCQRAIQDVLSRLDQDGRGIYVGKQYTIVNLRHDLKAALAGEKQS